jgi:glutamate dehydrogenase
MQRGEKMPNQSKESTYNPFYTAQSQFDRIARMLDLDPPTKDLLRSPMREYHFSIPIRMESGEARVFILKKVSIPSVL